MLTLKPRCFSLLEYTAGKKKVIEVIAYFLYNLYIFIRERRWGIVLCVALMS